MNTSENMNIEELLNGYIDGELTARQVTEVQRLISHDEAVARRLRQLEQCKALVGSLPAAETPADMLSRIRGLVDRRERISTRDSRAGARHLFYRQLVTAAAMLMLAGALGYVVYVIVAPGDGASRPVAMEHGIIPAEAAGTFGVEGDAGIEGELDGVIILKTDKLYAVDRYAHKVIYRNLGDGYSIERVPEERTVLTFRCSRDVFGRMMREVGGLWGTVASANVVLDGRGMGDGADVQVAEPDDIIAIFEERDYARRVELAKELSLSGGGVDEQQKSPLDVIPKPVLTTPEKADRTESDAEDDIVQISLVLEQI